MSSQPSPTPRQSNKPRTNGKIRKSSSLLSYPSNYLQIQPIRKVWLTLINSDAGLLKSMTLVFRSHSEEGGHRVPSLLPNVHILTEIVTSTERDTLVES
jgi:hypothetical protein